MKSITEHGDAARLRLPTFLNKKLQRENDFRHWESLDKPRQSERLPPFNQWLSWIACSHGCPTEA